MLNLSSQLRWIIALAAALASACGGAPEREDSSVIAAPDSTDNTSLVAAEEITTVSDDTRPHVQQPALPAPRRNAAIELEPLWTVGGPADPGRFIQPIRIAVSRLGVLVSEVDGARVLALDSRAGRIVDTIGRYGLGPGEFGRVPTLLGSYDKPLAFEGENGRLSLLVPGANPITSRVASGRRWISACAIDESHVILQYSGWDDDGYWISTIGEDAALVDSFSYPIPELLAALPLGRQAPLRQIDDSTCAILPAYGRQFAVYRRGRILIGVGVEEAPIPQVVDPGRGVGNIRRLADEVRSTHLQPGGWRGRLMVLYWGTSAHRGRLIDLYDANLKYESSVVLPFRAEDIAASGDTLFVLGELADEPILAAYLLRPR